MLEKVTESFHRQFHVLLEKYCTGACAAAEVTGHVRSTFTSPEEYGPERAHTLFGEKATIYLTPGGSPFSARARFYDKYQQVSRLQTRVFLTKDTLVEGQIIHVHIHGYPPRSKNPLFFLKFEYHTTGGCRPFFSELIYDPNQEVMKG